MKHKQWIPKVKILPDGTFKCVYCGAQFKTLKGIKKHRCAPGRYIQEISL